MDIAVTGSRGFIGQHIMKCLPGAVPLPHDSHLETSAEIVINCAWPPSSHASYNDEELQDCGEIFSRRVLASATHCRKFIGIGSQAEINIPSTAYGRAKSRVLNETRRECLRRGIEFAWMRVFTVYGLGDRSARVIPYIIHELRNGRVPYLSSGDAAWDFLHVSDAAVAIAMVATGDATGEFDVGSGRVVRIMDVACMIRDVINPTGDLGFGHRPAPSTDFRPIRANIERLLNLGWEPKIDIKHGIQMLVDGEVGK